MAIIAPVMIFIVLIVTVLTCVSDIRSLRIPNVYSLVVIGCFIPACLAEPAAFAPLWQHLATMAAVFFLTYAMFCMGMMGGGDSKLGTALGLWMGLKGLLAFIIYMGLAGGVLGLIALRLRKKKVFSNPRTGSWVEQVQAGQNAVPYGVAISFGFWASLFHTGFLHHQMDELFKIIH